MNKKQRVFVEEYLQCWNATEAARRAGYAYPNKQGPRLLVNVGISDAIKKRISEKAMSADEVLIRLAEQARGIPNEYREQATGQINIKQLIEDGLGHLIKKDYHNQQGRVLEFFDAQRALELLGKHHKLFTEKHDITSGGKRLGEPTQAIYDRAFSTLVNAVGTEIFGENGGSGGSVVAAE